MKFTIKIESDNAAMVDSPRVEVSAILEAVARKIYVGHNSGTVRDSNGNTVGSFELEVDFCRCHNKH